MRNLLIGLVHLYQYLIGPFIGNHCRFHPSCSHYAIEAIETHGALHGSRMTILRLLRCHPWHPGGYDPVPEKSHDEPTHG